MEFQALSFSPKGKPMFFVSVYRTPGALEISSSKPCHRAKEEIEVWRCRMIYSKTETH